MGKRVLVVQPSLQPPGGGNGVAAWLIESLAPVHQVTLLTWAPPNFDEVNRFFGTNLSSERIAVQTVPERARRFFDALPLPLVLLRNTDLMRRARRLSLSFDLLIGVDNEADLGPRAIQYIHFPRFEPERPAVDLFWYHRIIGALEAYRAVSLRLTGFSQQRMRKNLTLVNSDWTGRLMRALHGVDATTLYPPVSGTFRHVDWAERENGFLCIGRISEEKRIEEVIEVLARVRARSQGVHLRIIGSDRRGPYAERVRRRAERHRDWVTIERSISREALNARLVQYRYGVHGKEDEHFGIAVAEMVRGGCIPFVPDSGGQVEIVGDERLRYRSSTDAVDKICAVLDSQPLQHDLRQRLAARAALFSAERFTSEIRGLVERW